MGISQDLGTGQITLWLAGTRVTVSEAHARRLWLELGMAFNIPQRPAIRAYRDMLREVALND